MNAKRAKKLRKIVAKFENILPTISYHQRQFRVGVGGPDGQTITANVANPIRYPEMSRRRMYQDAKRAAQNLLRNSV